MLQQKRYKIILVTCLYFSLFFTSIVFASEIKCYNVSLYISDTIQLRNIRVLENCYVKNEVFNEDYYYILYDNDQKELEKGILSSSDSYLLDSSIYRFNVRYHGNGKKIVIFNSNDNQIKKEIDLSKYNSCGNHVCDNYENAKNCAIDCLTGVRDGVCDQFRDGMCDIDCLKQDGIRDYDCDNMEIVKNKKEVYEYLGDQKKVNIDNGKIINKKEDGDVYVLRKTMLILFIFIGIFLLTCSVIFWHKTKK